MSKRLSSSAIRDVPFVRSATAFRLTAGRIAAIYAAFGFLALYVSDVLFARMFDDPFLGQVQLLKGGIEVVVTAGLIFALTRWSHDQLETAKDRVQTQRDELDLLHRVMRHNLRNDLNIIRGRANLAMDDLEEEHPARSQCGSISAAADRMCRYTEHARHIRKVSETGSERQRIELGTVLNRVVTFHPDLTDDVDLETTIPAELVVTANPMLETAIEELITNAVEHNDATTPWVGVTAEATDSGSVRVCIADNGPGIPEDERVALDVESEDSIRHSTGLGLWFADWTVTHSGGELWIEDRDEGGSVVCFEVPAA
ncbi:MAG: sensor histidine kinase [Halobacteriaceae archaeon]